jgi:prolyl-tRNA editing enzyme YbaK/EbsC (Cys-tRNA(Pro) deacylase)
MSANAEPQGVARVREALALLGARGEVSEVGSGVDPTAVCSVFLTDGEPIAVVTSGGHAADPVQLSMILEAGTVTPASDEETRRATGFAAGSVPPVGHPRPLRTVIDIALSRFDEFSISAGAPGYTFPTTYDELLRITAGVAAETGA